MSWLLVTGTDTGVGKTWVTRALSLALRRAGHPVRALKPVESGCAEASASPQEDGVLLAQSAGQETPKEAFIRLRAPLAPPLAASLENQVLAIDQLENWLWKTYRQGSIHLVEGAGGLLSPLTHDGNFRDLALRLASPILLVACDCLGSLNHTLLSLEAAENVGLEVRGVVFSAPATPDESTGTNHQEIKKVRADLPALCLPRAQVDDAIDHLSSAMEWIIR